MEMKNRQQPPLSTGRKRGRPPRSEGALLTREGLIDTALRIAGQEGFPALSMHRLAREMNVSTRALYNHVKDRQELIDAVAALLMRKLPAPCFDASDWQESLRTAYTLARDAYRTYPRAILISLDETVTPGRIDPQRIIITERMLEFFVNIGLSLPQAIAVRRAFLLDLFAFTLTVDYHYDTGSPEFQKVISQPVPSPWLEALPDVVAPLSRSAAQLPALNSDDLFREIVELRISAIENLLERSSLSSSS